MDNTPYVFLIGGHDLEMLTIKKLLMDNGFSEEKTIADLNLQWGAKLSDYQNLFNDSQTFVGIELTQDVAPPPHYINIDHHNQNSNKSSSLEQVAELLGFELNHEQLLIAANDSGYIPAMLEMGATPKEVADIRRRDREAQGVTGEDEQLAEQSIRENITVENGITVVKSLTSKFSTITDRLYPCEQLLIYTDDELTYYGEYVNRLILTFAELIEKGIAYSRRGQFFGVGYNRLPTNELMKVKNEMITILTYQTT